MFIYCYVWFFLLISRILSENHSEIASDYGYGDVIYANIENHDDSILNDEHEINFPAECNYEPENSILIIPINCHNNTATFTVPTDDIFRLSFQIHMKNTQSNCNYTVSFNNRVLFHATPAENGTAFYVNDDKFISKGIVFAISSKLVIINADDYKAEENSTVNITHTKQNQISIVTSNPLFCRGVVKIPTQGIVYDERLDVQTFYMYISTITLLLITALSLLVYLVHNLVLIALNKKSSHETKHGSTLHKRFFVFGKKSHVKEEVSTEDSNISSATEQMENTHSNIEQGQSAFEEKSCDNTSMSDKKKSQ